MFLTRPPSRLLPLGAPANWPLSPEPPKTAAKPCRCAGWTRTTSVSRLGGGATGRRVRLSARTADTSASGSVRLESHSLSFLCRHRSGRRSDTIAEQAVEACQGHRLGAICTRGASAWSMRRLSWMENPVHRTVAGRRNPGRQETHQAMCFRVPGKPASSSTWMVRGQRQAYPGLPVGIFQGHQFIRITHPPGVRGAKSPEGTDYRAPTGTQFGLWPTV